MLSSSIYQEVQGLLLHSKGYPGLGKGVQTLTPSVFFLDDHSLILGLFLWVFSGPMTFLLEISTVVLT